MEREEADLREKIDSEQKKVDSLGKLLSDEHRLYDEIYNKARSEAYARAVNDFETQFSSQREQLASTLDALQTKTQTLSATETKLSATEMSVEAGKRKLKKINEVYKRMQNAIALLDNAESKSAALNPDSLIEVDLREALEPTVEIPLNYMNVRDLRKQFNRNKKVIVETLERYQRRYTTKANASIYQLMTIALEAELQNILYNLEYGKLESSLSFVQKMIDRYLSIAVTGNQSISPTLIKFIGEIQVLYTNAVNIEYEYHIQRERAREEQRAIREQMREEARDRKRLAEEQKKLEQEAEKYNQEINSIREQIDASADEHRILVLQQRLDELTAQVCTLEERKDEIIARQNGQAGYVYIISNLGSFGNEVFKIGMTRRLDPQERIDELSGASVPFPFDVHGMIFSENAPSLERNLHMAINDKRVNRVNLRKEFFRISLNDLEALVYEQEASVEFKRTMLAEQYYQSMSANLPSENTTGYEELDDEEGDDQDIA